MLNDWEQQRWSSIKRELSSDTTFAKYYTGPAGRTVDASAFWQRFYPGGYLGGALAYMLLAMGGGPRILGGLLLALLVAWWLVELHRVWGTRVLGRVRRRHWH